MAAHGYCLGPFLTCVILLLMFDLGNGLNTVQIQVSTPIELHQDDLEITCSAHGSFLYVTSYTLYKNDSNGMVKQIVQQTYLINESSVVTTWTDRGLQNRANLSDAALPSPQATMVLTISSTHVRYPEDAAGYRCDFSAIVRLGGDSPVTQSKLEYAEITRNIKTTTPTSVGHRQGFNIPSFISTWMAIILVTVAFES